MDLQDKNQRQQRQQAPGEIQRQGQIGLAAAGEGAGGGDFLREAVDQVPQQQPAHQGGGHGAETENELVGAKIGQYPFHEAPHSDFFSV